jgi:hypothetical protein
LAHLKLNKGIICTEEKWQVNQAKVHAESVEVKARKVNTNAYFI